MLLMLVGAVIGMLVTLAVLLSWTRRAVIKAAQAARKELLANDEKLYKVRWESALELLQGEGRLTEDEKKSILGPVTPQLERPTVEDQPLPQDVLNKMQSAHRMNLEVDRARRGLPRVDTLEGMQSAHIPVVMAAHAHNAKKPEPSA